jgi:glucosyl-3-phosphoglycerate synthase
MADFHQSGSITTLHRLGRPDVERLEEELLQHSRVRPVALVLPCLFSELRGPALKGIVDALRGVRYLSEIVVSISGAAARTDYEEMRSLFDGVTTLSGEPPVLLWNSGKRVQALLETLRE